MEKEKRNQVTSFLLVVGIVFIVVSGTIFASTAWKNLSERVRECILLFLSAGLFAGSWQFSRKGIMEKTEAALYYLASSFLGLFILLVFGGITGAGQLDRGNLLYAEDLKELLDNMRYGLNSGALLAAAIAVFFAFIIRFFWKHGTFDFIGMALLADFVIFWITVCFRIGMFGSSILSGTGLCVYTVAYCLRKKWQGGSRKMELAFLMLYFLHVLTFYIHFLLLEVIQDPLLLYAAFWLMTLFIVINTGLLYKAEEKTVFRVLNSIGIFLWLTAGVFFLAEILQTVLHAGEERFLSTDLLWFISVTLCALCMTVFARMEMFITVITAGMCIPFLQIFGYGGYNILFIPIRHEISAYMPYSVVLAAAMAALLWRWGRSGAVEKEKLKRYAVMVVLQVPVVFTVFLASKFSMFHEGMSILSAIVCCSISMFFKDRTGRGIFQTFALAFMVRFVSIVANWIAEDYRTEFVCLGIAAGLFLLEKIWCRETKQALKGIRMTQFTGACIIAAILLLHVFTLGKIGNGLILGVVSVLTLILAFVYNNRAYALLSSIVLVLLAFYLTRDFWFSIAWWVYLFIAGVVMVALAIKYEKKK